MAELDDPINLRIVRQGPDVTGQYPQDQVPAVLHRSAQAVLLPDRLD
jgi:hypothetical protein